MIGGSGPKKTLRTLARYGDQWNSMGTVDELARARRDPARALRDDRARRRRDRADDHARHRDPRHHEAGLAYYKARLAADGEEFDPDWNFFVGPPAEIAEGLQPILELGFRHVLVDMPAPYDLETIGRIGELIELLNA